jgi:two-component system LytT family response regulator
MIRLLLVGKSPQDFEEINEVIQGNNRIEICGQVLLKKNLTQFLSIKEIDLIVSTTSFMDGEDTLDILEKEKLAKNFEVVLIDDDTLHAYKAFKMGALDYLVKPFKKNEWNQVVSKAEKKIKENDRLVKEIINVIQKISLKNNKISLQHKKTTEIIDIDNILYVQADMNYCHVHVKNEKPILVSKPLRSIEQKLTGFDHFLRVHQSFLINKHFIRRIYKGKLPQVMMTNGDIISVSRSNKSHFHKSVVSW